MKKIYFVFLFVVVCSLPLISVAGRLQDAQKSVISARGSSSSSSSSSSSGCPACSLDIDDNLASAGTWTEDYGDWSFATYCTNDTAWSDAFARSTTTVTAGACQWAGVTMYTLGSDSNPGMFLNATAGTSGYRDVIRYSVTNTRFEWAVFNAQTSDEVVTTQSHTLGATDTFAAQRTAAGYDVWVNPSGTCPDDWGAATYSLNGTPTNTASGIYFGMFESHGNNQSQFADFMGGD